MHLTDNSWVLRASHPSELQRRYHEYIDEHFGDPIVVLRREVRRQMKIELIDELDRRYGPDWDRRFRLLDLDALLGPPLDTSSDQS